jgi:hypothetical protein
MPPREFQYETDQLDGAKIGISDVLMASASQLLILERGFRKDWGNTVRIFRVDVPLQDTDGSTPVLQKHALMFDLLDVQPNLEPLGRFGNMWSKKLGGTLENFEGMTWGPVLSSGKRTLLLVSDDNFLKDAPDELTAALAIDHSGLQPPKRFGKPQFPVHDCN